MKYREVKRDRFARHLTIDISNNADWLLLFLMFSRFEYALKRSGYIKRFRNNRLSPRPITPPLNFSALPILRNAEADWDEFGKAIERRLQNIDSAELHDAINFLSNNPPWRLGVNEENELEWYPSHSSRNVTGIIGSIKTVRNNLFHGGKYPTMPTQDPSGDILLIKNSIIVLKHMIGVIPEVERYYFEGLG